MSFCLEKRPCEHPSLSLFSLAVPGLSLHTVDCLNALNACDQAHFRFVDRETVRRSHDRWWKRKCYRDSSGFLLLHCWCLLRFRLLRRSSRQGNKKNELRKSHQVSGFFNDVSTSRSQQKSDGFASTISCEGCLNRTDLFFCGIFVPTVVSRNRFHCQLFQKHIALSAQRKDRLLHLPQEGSSV